MTHNSPHARIGNPLMKPRAIVWDLFGDHLRYVGGGVVPMRALNQLLDLFGIGASWGGFESLALPTTGFVTRTASAKFAGPLVRLHIGLEDVDDLIADLERGLKVMRAFERERSERYALLRVEPGWWGWVESNPS